ncbi:MAG TPA: DUF1285 domain-containing protein [bacterium]|nr:DUF1285 domain-containing protein [bacterium]
MSGKPEPAEIIIDKNCNWTANGMQMVNEKIFKLFCESLVKEGDSYFIRIGNQENPVIVEDVPFCVKHVFLENTAEGKDVLRLLLNDQRMADLEPESLRSLNKESVYCRINGSNMEAKFSREAITQLGNFIELDPESGEFFLELNSKKYFIRQKSDG